MSSRGSTKPKRLFFALWPDAVLRAAADKLGRKWLHKRGKHLEPENLHITLAFLGSIPPEQFDCVVAAADSVVGMPFELQLDRLGQFLRARVAWLGSSETPAPLQQLVRDLNAALVACDYQPEVRPYHAHLTLARKISESVDSIPFQPLEWSVADFVLVESLTHPEGVEYRVLKRWGLE